MTDKEGLPALTTQGSRLRVHYICPQIMKLDGGEFNMMAGEFNDFTHVSKEQWDMMEAKIKKVQGS